MSDSSPSHRHAAPRAPRRIAAGTAPSLLAVLAVVTLIGALSVLRGTEPDGQGAAPPRTRSASPTAAAARLDARVAEPAASASTRGRKAGLPGSQQTAGARTRPPKAPDRQGVPVVVLNQTSRTGLAAAVAGILRGRGWTVPAVGNFRGIVPATTVYYPPGTEAAAQDLAESLPTPPRIRPRFDTLSPTRLTVVLTSSYPG